MRKKTALIILGLPLFVGMVLVGCGKKETEKTRGPVLSIAGVLPAGGEVEGWQRDDTIKTYDATTLSSVVDDVEKYLNYGFVEACFAGYSGGSGATAEIRLFDMDASENAFGIYNMYDDVGRKRAPEGIHGAVSDNSMDFCKGRFFVRISVSGLDPVKSEAAVKQFGSIIDRKLRRGAEVPKIVGLLPEGYIPGTVRYFTNWKNLNGIYYVGDENLLMIDSEARGALAAYSVENKNTESGTRKVASDKVFVITYPIAKRNMAEEAFVRYIDYYSKKKGFRVVGLFNIPKRVLVHKDNKLVSIVYIHDNHLFGAWNPHDASKRENALNKLIDELKISTAQKAEIKVK